MKTPTLLFALLLSPLASLPAFAASGKATVSFNHPEKFTDVRSEVDSAQERDRLLGELKAHVEKEAAKYVAADQTLNVTINDVDMAGGFDPSRPPPRDDMRLFRDVYPPHISLEFKLTDASGNVLSSGKRELSDTAYLMHSEARFDQSDVRYEKILLSDWLRKEFRK